MGPNFILDKGFLASGTSGYAFGEIVVLTNATTVAKAGAAGKAIGICQEDIDAEKVATGKAVIGVRILGISRVIAGAAVAVGDNVASNASSRAIKAVATNPVVGMALTAATAAGDQIDVLMTPGIVA